MSTDSVTPKRIAQLMADLQVIRQGMNDSLHALLRILEEAVAQQKTISPHIADAVSALREAQSGITRMSEMLVLLSGSLPAPYTPAIPLDQFDTPDTRELLALLEQAQVVAERVDRARGHSVREDIPLSPGESAGTDLAENISRIALRVRQEVRGASSPWE